MPRALFSVSNKKGLRGFASELIRIGWEIVASGGTAENLREAGLPVTSVQDVTRQAEMLGGRVKTLHPALHGGILARDTPGDMNELAQAGFAPISLVACNLYPFSEAIQQADITEAAAIEHIDIGGCTLLRGAAKNFARVTVLCDPLDYADVLLALKTAGSTSLQQRRQLAVKAFAHTRNYDSAIHAYLGESDIVAPADSPPPEVVELSLRRSHALRYGENPHQAAAYYSRSQSPLPLDAEQLAGKQLSYNNILDIDAAWRAACSYDAPTVVIVKHLTPTGIASADSIAEAFPLALESDALSAFGGIIALNRQVDEPFVSALETLFVEAIAAPDFSDAALEQLLARSKNCRILRMQRRFVGGGFECRSVMGGLLLQRYDRGDPAPVVMKTVTKRNPSEEEMLSLQFAWRAVQHVRSNAIVLARGQRTVGIGGGLPSRVDAVELALKKAGAHAAGAALASDAYFPFPDSIERAQEAGVRCVIQPGGSIRDSQVIAAADHHGMAMLFTSRRHFRH